jgi:hypothetical protein
MKIHIGESQVGSRINSLPPNFFILIDHHKAPESASQGAVMMVGGLLLLGYLGKRLQPRHRLIPQSHRFNHGSFVRIHIAGGVVVFGLAKLALGEEEWVFPALLGSEFVGGGVFVPVELGDVYATGV